MMFQMGVTERVQFNSRILLEEMESVVHCLNCIEFSLIKSLFRILRDKVIPCKLFKNLKMDSIGISKLEVHLHELIHLSCQCALAFVSSEHAQLYIGWK